jgi:hypothetical protein
MTNHPLAVEYSPHLLDRVAARIAPFFTGGGTILSDSQCRAVARETMVSFQPATAKELQLVAQIIALEMGGLECLSCSVQVPAEQYETVLKIQEDAIELHDIANELHRQFEAKQRERGRGQATAPEAKAFDEAEFSVIMSKARTIVTYARTKGEAARIAQAMETPPAGKRRATPTRQIADKAWADELQNLSSWVQQTRH